jgi:hypothetical protein
MAFAMQKIPRRYAHFLFGVAQSGLTCFVAAAIASLPFLGTGTFVAHWLLAWAISWATMLPIVLAAAPAIKRLVEALTKKG